MGGGGGGVVQSRSPPCGSHSREKTPTPGSESKGMGVPRERRLLQGVGVKGEGSDSGEKTPTWGRSDKEEEREKKDSDGTPPPNTSLFLLCVGKRRDEGSYRIFTLSFTPSREQVTFTLHPRRCQSQLPLAAASQTVGVVPR